MTKHNSEPITGTAQALALAVDRLVRNVAIERGISTERAAFLIRSELGRHGGRAPTPTSPPVVSLPKAA